MRDPIKTKDSLTVQRKLDLLNENLYADTDDIDIHVELACTQDYIIVIQYFHGAVYEVRHAYTASILYSILDDLSYEARFHSHETWYDRAYEDEKNHWYIW